jgi:hypothetical protein
MDPHLTEIERRPDRGVLLTAYVGVANIDGLVAGIPGGTRAGDRRRVGVGLGAGDVGTADIVGPTRRERPAVGDLHHVGIGRIYVNLSVTNGDAGHACDASSVDCQLVVRGGAEGYYIEGVANKHVPDTGQHTDGVYGDVIFFDPFLSA